MRAPFEVMAVSLTDSATVQRGSGGSGKVAASKMTPRSRKPARQSFDSATGGGGSDAGVGDAGGGDAGGGDSGAAGAAGGAATAGAASGPPGGVGIAGLCGGRG